MILRELFASIGIKADQSGFQRAEGMINSLKKALVGVGLVFGAHEIYKELKHLVNETAAAASGSTKAAQRLGITGEAFDELSHAATHSGVSAGALEHGLRFLNRTIFESGRRGGETGKLFKQMGVNIGHGKRSAVDVLEDLAEGFKRMPEGPQRGATAARLFGRTIGAELVPLLVKGKEGVHELRMEAHKLGLVFSDEDRAAAKAYKFASIELSASLEVLKRSIGVPLMRLFAENKRGLTEWIEKNRALIRDKVVEWVNRLVTVLKALMSFVHGAAEGVGVFVHWLREAANTSDALRYAFVALGIGIAFALAPATSAILGVMMLFEEFWGWVTGKRKTVLGDLLGPFDKFAEKFSHPLDKLKKWADDLFKKLKEDVANLFTGAIKADDWWVVKKIKTATANVELLLAALAKVDAWFGGPVSKTLKKILPEGLGGTPGQGMNPTTDLFGRPLNLKVGEGDQPSAAKLGAFIKRNIVGGGPKTDLFGRPMSEEGQPAWAGKAGDFIAGLFDHEGKDLFGRPLTGAIAIPAMEPPTQIITFNFGDIVTPSPADFVRQVEPEVRRVLRQELGEAQTAVTR